MEEQPQKTEEPQKTDKFDEQMQKKHFSETAGTSEEEKKKVRTEEKAKKKKERKRLRGLIPNWRRAKKRHKSIAYTSLAISTLVYSYYVYFKFLRGEFASPDYTTWYSVKMLMSYFLVSLPIIPIIIFLIIVRFSRTRWDTERDLYLNKDINEWLVIFNWTHNIFHIPTIIIGFSACFLTWQFPEYRNIFGAIWFATFLICACIKEFDLSLLKLVLIMVCAILVLVLFIFVERMGWLAEMFAKIHLFMSPHLYFFFSLWFLSTIVLSFVRGLFDYRVITPNVLIKEFGIGQDADPFERKKYSVAIDTTSDFVQWLLFNAGLMIVKIEGEPPEIILVGRIKRKAKWLKDVLSVIAIDRHPPSASRHEEEEL